MSAKTVIKSMIQKGDKKASAMNKMFDNANVQAAKANEIKKENKKK